MAAVLLNNKSYSLKMINELIKSGNLGGSFGQEVSYWNEQLIEQAMEQFSASIIITGTSEVPHITTCQNGKVYQVKTTQGNEALLITDGQFTRLSLTRDQGCL
jgi:tyrosine-protein phosphatase YwqE